MNYLTIYLITRLDVVHAISLNILILVAIFFTVGFIVTFGDSEADLLIKKFKKVTPVIFFSGLIIMLVPTQKEAAAIWLIPKVVNNERIQNISSCSLNIIEVKVKDYLTELAKIKDDKSR